MAGLRLPGRRFLITRAQDGSHAVFTTSWVIPIVTCDCRGQPHSRNQELGSLRPIVGAGHCSSFQGMLTSLKTAVPRVVASSSHSHQQNAWPVCRTSSPTVIINFSCPGQVVIILQRVFTGYSILCFQLLSFRPSEVYSPFSSSVFIEVRRQSCCSVDVNVSLFPLRAFKISCLWVSEVFLYLSCLDS